MKRLVTFVFSVLFFIAASAQGPSFSREVVASAGDFFVSPAGSLSWTLGETITETLENTSINIVLTQGFQQPDELIIIDTIDGIWAVPSSSIFVNLYPNPSVQFVKLDLKYDANSLLKIELVDMLGRVINTQQLDVVKGQLTNCEVDVSTLSAGMYMFKLTDNGFLLNSYKFQKVSN